LSKRKYYVVWNGRKTGVFQTWEQCKAQVDGYPEARYKSFKSKEEAEAAYKAGPEVLKKMGSKQTQASKGYIEESISVDAACSGNPGPMEYRGVYTRNGKEIFRHGPVQNGTNNIGEFLAIVHALALLKKKNSTLPIYSDSATAIGWVKKKRANTTLVRDESTREIWDLLDRATLWLNRHAYPNEILKWETSGWGEIKADFGRK